MQINNIPRSSVGADLSRTPPIYRTSVGYHISGLFFNSHYRVYFKGENEHDDN